MNERTNEAFNANWIGRCPCKGCDTIIHIDVPMVRQRWTTERFCHMSGQRYSVGHSISFPAHLNSHWERWTPSGLELHCVKHRRALRWQAVNGKLSEAHVCDARCMDAKGHNCECSCGGANHGRGYHVAMAWH